MKRSVAALGALVFAVALATAAATGSTGAAGASGASLGKAATPSSTLAGIKKRGVLRVGVGIYPPQAAQTPGGKVTGIDIEIFNRLAQKLRVKVKYTVVGYDVIVAGLQTNKWDITTGLITSPERKKVAAFSTPTYTVDQVYFVRSDSAFNSIADLNKPEVTIINTTGSYDEQVRAKYLPNSKSRAVAGMSQAQQIAEVLSGRADAANVETPFTTRRIQAQFKDKIRFIPDVTKGEKALETSPVAFAFRKGDPAFGTTVNVLLRDLRKSGAMDKIFAKYTNSLLGPIK